MARIPRLRTQLRQMNELMPHQTVQVGRHQRAIHPPPAGRGSGQYGPPSIYDPIRFPHMANVLCKEYGFTASQMGKVFGVSVKTVNSWMQLHQPFKEAVLAGKDEFDSCKVENALLKIALGYQFDETTVRRVTVKGTDSEGNKLRVPAKETTITTKCLPPNVKAISLWLTNRQPERWKLTSTVNATINSKTEHTERSLKVTADMSKMTSVQLRALRDLLSTQAPTECVELENNNNEGTLLLEMLDTAREVFEEADYVE